MRSVSSNTSVVRFEISAAASLFALAASAARSRISSRNSISFNRSCSISFRFSSLPECRCLSKLAHAAARRFTSFEAKSTSTRNSALRSIASTALWSAACAACSARTARFLFSALSSAAWRTESSCFSRTIALRSAATAAALAPVARSDAAPAVSRGAPRTAIANRADAASRVSWLTISISSSVLRALKTHTHACRASLLDVAM
mmetsp:Transcript_3982/g.13278  ORF Transcript_3982/g.13278 Transcript_3982/m.13278 type:complete len:204 (-) Transcript_3982:393-1004(-)